MRRPRDYTTHYSLPARLLRIQKEEVEKPKRVTRAKTITKPNEKHRYVRCTYTLIYWVCYMRVLSARAMLRSLENQ